MRDRTHMDRCLSTQDLNSLVDQSMAQSQLAAVKRHLRLCDACAARLARRRMGQAPNTTDGVPSGEDAGHPSSSPLGLEPNVKIGDYRIERRLGAGGMGIVYQAIQISLKRPVALKVLPAGPLTSAAVIERFHREAQAVAKLRHPNIVSIYEERAEQHLCYYAMELVKGQSLDAYIKDYPRSSGRSKSWGRSHYDGFASIIATLAEALDYAHQQGIIHRDIKPSNVMVTPEGRPMLMDFGIARILDDPGMTMSSTFLGTPLYMSPEQIGASAAEVDGRTDVYSLGATLYELITGQPLYKGLKTRQQIIAHMLRKPVRRPCQIDDRIPVDLETICLKALEFDPAERYSSAGDMAEDLQRYLRHQIIKAKPAGLGKRLHNLVVRHKAASMLLAVTTIAAAAALSLSWQNNLSKRIHRLLPELRRCVDEDRFFSAYLLTRELKRLGVDDPAVTEALFNTTHEHHFVTSPVAAEVLVQDYFDAEGPWISLGKTPISSIRLPYGINRFRVKAAGYLTLECAIFNRKDYPYYPDWKIDTDPREINWTLHRPGQLPENMVWIPGVNLSQSGLFHSYHDVPNTEPFLMDKFEVTNRDYKAFVDAGGYQDLRFWQEPLVRDGIEVGWVQAQQAFVDQTGLPGPSTWRNGTYPPGQENYPVGGVSWFEAAAYARYCGKDLPTAFHWIRASSSCKVDARVAAFSNFSGQPSPVGRHRGMGRYGLYDAGGNVREWCFNTVEGQGEARCIMGGTYDSPSYKFRASFFTSPWDRAPYNGFRCAQYVNGRDRVPPDAFASLEFEQRDWEGFRPLSPATYEEYCETLYDYEKKPLHAKIDSVDHEMGICRRERISFDAAYANERVIAYLHLPLNSRPPYQTVLWYPGSGAEQMSWEQFAQNYHDILEHLMRRGRAVVIPIYQNTYHRRIDTSSWEPFGLQRRNLRVQCTQDLARTIDYLTTRPDIDDKKLAYLGYSWGASDGPRLLAYEDRISTAIFLYGGYCFCTGSRHPSVDPARFAPYLTCPALVINGRDSVYQPYESAQKPFFDLLGAPDEDKKMILFPGGHTIPWEYRKQHDQAIFDWLDKYLGPVEAADE